MSFRHRATLLALGAAKYPIYYEAFSFPTYRHISAYYFWRIVVFQSLVELRTDFKATGVCLYDPLCHTFRFFDMHRSGIQHMDMGFSSHA